MEDFYRQQMVLLVFLFHPKTKQNHPLCRKKMAEDKSITYIRLSRRDELL